MQRKADVADVQAKTKLLQARGIEVGMFIMFGYEGEEIADLEATVTHLKKASPDVFLTTVAYPIKGTAYYESVAGRVVTDQPWAERTDRDLGVAGRHSRRFYEHATRWVINEIGWHRARQQGTVSLLEMGRLFLNARRGRLGMMLTGGQREEGQSAGSGRGWSAQDRAGDGW
jgi:radical SAM superfamily enzyme YgiQ (UPF0313 family)